MKPYPFYRSYKHNLYSSTLGAPTPSPFDLIPIERCDLLS